MRRRLNEECRLVEFRENCWWPMSIINKQNLFSGSSSSLSWKIEFRKSLITLNNSVHIAIVIQHQFYLKWNRIKARDIITAFLPPVLYKSYHCDSPRQQSCSSGLTIWGQFWHLHGYEALVASMGLLAVSITSCRSRSVRGIGSSLRIIWGSGLFYCYI